MNISEIRALYDQQQRIDNQDTGVRILPTPHTVRMIDDAIGQGVIIYSALNDSNADEIIRAELDFFRTQPKITEIEWKCFDYDQPPDLLDRLKAHGFVVEEPDAICVLDLAALPDQLRQPVTHDIRRITDPSGLDDVFAVQAAVWDEDSSSSDGWLRTILENNLRTSPETISIYVAYVDGVPASSCWMDIHEGRAFSGLWGGSTLEQYRGRGLYTQLIAIRAQEAIRRGIRYLTIDASPMSRRIVEKRGFKFMAYAYECNFHFDRGT